LDRLKQKEKVSKEKSVNQPEERLPEFISGGGIPIKRQYTPKDLEGFDYDTMLGDAGQYPYTRGIYPDMYRTRLWQQQQLFGFGQAEDARQRAKFLLDKGESDVAFWILVDMPTLLGYDPDDPKAEGEVGRCGVAIPTFRDLELLFEGMPLDRLTSGITINAASLPVMAMFVALAQKRGLPLSKLKGACQNDILKEYEISGAYMYPPRDGLRLQSDVVEYCTKNLPSWTPFSTTSYFIRESGTTVTQEIGFTLANAMTYLESARRRGIDINKLASNLSFYIWVGTDVLEEVAKMRAMRRMWAKIMKNKFGVTEPKALMPRFGMSTGGSLLTAQQPLNNIARATLTMLAGALGGAQTATLMCYDEGQEIPTEEAQKVAIRTQQIVAYEAGVANTIDPLAGSYYIESLTNKLEEEATAYIEKIESIGDDDILEGVMRGIETGYFQKEIRASAFRHQMAIETGKEVIVGVNRFIEEEERPIELFQPPLTAQQELVQRINLLKKERDNRKVETLLGEIGKVAQSGENLMPVTIEAVKANATLGEICGVFREVFGLHKE